MFHIFYEEELSKQIKLINLSLLHEALAGNIVNVNVSLFPAFVWARASNHFQQRYYIICICTGIYLFTVFYIFLSKKNFQFQYYNMCISTNVTLGIIGKHICKLINHALHTYPLNWVLSVLCILHPNRHTHFKESQIICNICSYMLHYY